MRHLTPIFALALLAGCSSRQAKQQSGHRPDTGGTAQAQHGNHTHGDAHAGHSEVAGGLLMVETEPARPTAGQATTLRLMIHEAGGAMVRDFETVHEAKVHLIVVRDGLDQFAHLHPEVREDGNLMTSYTFPVAGLYRLYADYQPAGKAGAVASAEVQVAGAGALAPPLTVSAPGRVKGDGLDAEVAVQNAKAGEKTKILFRPLDASSQTVTDLQPYLGAMGHLVLLSADGKEYVHAHPAGNGLADGQVEFEAQMKQSGLYKGWGQFRRGGKVFTVPFVVRVD